MPDRRRLAEAPLVGRQHELASLEALLDGATVGRGRTVLLEGEAGIGKSRLVGEMLAHAGDAGFRIASGRAAELEQTRPFGVLVAALGISASCAHPALARIAGLPTSSRQRRVP